MGDLALPFVKKRRGGGAIEADHAHAALIERASRQDQWRDICGQPIGVGRCPREAAGGIDLLAEARQRPSFGRQLGRERRGQIFHVRVLYGLKVTGEACFAKPSVIERHVDRRLFRVHLAERPHPAFRADQLRQSGHQAVLGRGVVGVERGDLGDEADHGACVVFGNEGFHQRLVKQPLFPS